MATIQESIYARLLGDDAIVALVVDRVYPDELPDHDVPAPFVFYEVTETAPVQTLDGTSMSVRHRVEFHVLADTYAEMNDLATAVRTALNGWRGGQVKRALWEGSQSGTTEQGFHSELSFTIFGVDVPIVPVQSGLPRLEIQEDGLYLGGDRFVIESELSGLAPIASPIFTGDVTTDGVYVGNGSGLTELDASQLTTGIIPALRLPAIALVEFLGEAEDETAMLGLDGQQGDWCARIDLGTTWIIIGPDPSDVGSWRELQYPSHVHPLRDLTGLATNMATFLGTPSSANLRATLTDEDGTGNALFANSYAGLSLTPTSGGSANPTFYSANSNVIDPGLAWNATSSGNGFSFWKNQSGTKTLIARLQDNGFCLFSSFGTVNNFLIGDFYVARGTLGAKASWGGGGEPAVLVAGQADIGFSTMFQVTAYEGTPALTLITSTTGDDPNFVVRQARAATTDATVTTLQTIAIAASNTYMIEVRAIARRTGGSSGTANDGACYVRRAMVTTKSGTVTINSVVDVFTQEDQAGWDCTLSVSSTNILVQVTGATNNNVTWHCTTIVQNLGS